MVIPMCICRIHFPSSLLFNHGESSLRISECQGLLSQDWMPSRSCKHKRARIVGSCPKTLYTIFALLLAADCTHVMQNTWLQIICRLILSDLHTCSHNPALISSLEDLNSRLGLEISQSPVIVRSSLPDALHNPGLRSQC